jgi:hypothetical protein
MTITIKAPAAEVFNAEITRLRLELCDAYDEIDDKTEALAEMERVLRMVFQLTGTALETIRERTKNDSSDNGS